LPFCKFICPHKMHGENDMGTLTHKEEVLHGLSHPDLLFLFGYFY
jgi:hypothetical protein